MSKFGFDRVLRNIEQVKRDLPPILANDGQRFFYDSWQKQGWDDGTVKGWKPRKKETKRTAGKQILVASGDLKRAVNNCIKSVTPNGVRFAVDNVDYAGYVNDGTGKMVAREFMGPSKTLDKIIKNRITQVIDKIWQG